VAAKKKEDPRMEKMILRIFQKEIEKQCKFAIIAIKQIKAGLTNNNLDLVWYAIQSFLVSVANISKILWSNSKPQKKEGELRDKRREELRKSLGIEDDSPIKPKIFRNCFEHFDERLEKWAASSKRRNFVDSNIAPSNMIMGIDPEDFLRNFDPTSWILTFRGDKYELKPVIEVIYNLYAKLSAEANKL
jgi:hypothetical protein